MIAKSLGPKMLARIAKHTGLSPSDLWTSAIGKARRGRRCRTKSPAPPSASARQAGAAPPRQRQPPARPSATLPAPVAWPQPMTSHRHAHSAQVGADNPVCEPMHRGMFRPFPGPSALALPAPFIVIIDAGHRPTAAGRRCHCAFASHAQCVRGHPAGEGRGVSPSRAGRVISFRPQARRAMPRHITRPPVRVSAAGRGCHRPFHRPCRRRAVSSTGASCPCSSSSCASG